jgi:hypothetical protein
VIKASEVYHKETFSIYSAILTVWFTFNIVVKNPATQAWGKHFKNPDNPDIQGTM